MLKKQFQFIHVMQVARSESWWRIPPNRALKNPAQTSNATSSPHEPAESDHAAKEGTENYKRCTFGLHGPRTQTSPHIVGSTSCRLLSPPCCFLSGRALTCGIALDFVVLAQSLLCRAVHGGHSASHLTHEGQHVWQPRFQGLFRLFSWAKRPWERGCTFGGELFLHYAAKL